MRLVVPDRGLSSPIELSRVSAVRSPLSTASQRFVARHCVLSRLFHRIEREPAVLQVVIVCVL